MEGKRATVRQPACKPSLPPLGTGQSKGLLLSAWARSLELVIRIPHVGHFNRPWSGYVLLWAFHRRFCACLFNLPVSCTLGIMRTLHLLAVRTGLISPFQWTYPTRSTTRSRVNSMKVASWAPTSAKSKHSPHSYRPLFSSSILSPSPRPPKLSLKLWGCTYQRGRKTAIDFSSRY